MLNKKEKDIIRGQLANRGALVSCNDKIPTVEGWSELKKDYNSRDLDWTTADSIAFVIPKDILVIDIDVGVVNGKDEINKIINTLNIDTKGFYIVDTPSGGCHLYLTKDTRVRYKSDGLKKFLKNKNIEIKSITSDGNSDKVIAPTSKTTSGNYVLRQGENVGLKRMPDILDALFNLNTENAIEAFLKVCKKASEEEPAVSGKQGNNQSYSVMCSIMENLSNLYQDNGKLKKIATLVFEKCYNPNCVPEWSHAKILEFSDNALKYGRNTTEEKKKEIDKQRNDDLAFKLIRNDKDKVVFNATNLQYILEDSSEFLGLCWNVRRDDMVFKVVPSFITGYNKEDIKKGFGVRITDYHLQEIIVHLEQRYPFDSKINRELKNIRLAMQTVAQRRKFDPVKELIENTVWDGKQRVDKFFSVLGLETDEGEEFSKDCNFDTTEGKLTEVMSRMFFTGIVSRTFERGSKFDFMFIITSPQGYMKSSFLKVLAFDEMEFFTDKISNAKSDENFFGLVGKMVVEWAELSNLDTQTVEEVKQFISSEYEARRKPYAGHLTEIPRSFILAGTTNRDTFLNDCENRRFPCLSATKPINNNLVRENLLQLYAEAYHMLRNGEAKLYWESFDTYEEDEEGNVLTDDRGEPLHKVNNNYKERNEKNNEKYLLMCHIHDVFVKFVKDNSSTISKLYFQDFMNELYPEQNKRKLNKVDSHALERTLFKFKYQKKREKGTGKVYFAKKIKK